MFVKAKDDDWKLFLTIKRKIYASKVQFKNQFYVSINEEGQREFISSDDDVQFIIKISG
ncbi:hypothetical protein [Mycoplasmopsis lipofaciens]|uniref:hypothetical protein n=1 Tax=Mycoplasmopsis lipofaciens TaxID=114884 RepID=UPI000A8273E0|nr:hypothetical protein [Mycoplasmopsis lipofaciens]